MHTNGSNTNRRLHRGSFADGQASRDRDPGERHVGTFSEGEARPDVYPGQNHLGTFAEGESQPNEYCREDHEGTFAQGANTVMSETPSIDHRCTRGGARRIYQLRAPENHPDKSRV